MKVNSSEKLVISTYNVFGGGPFAEERLPLLQAAFKSPLPHDIVLLQEATPTIRKAIQHLSGLNYSWTKSDTLPEGRKFAVHAGELCCLSRYPILESRLIRNGSWHDDGIVRHVIDTTTLSGSTLVVYNVHLSGGSYGKKEQDILKKKQLRVEELLDLKASLSQDNQAIVAGDFNFDSDQANNCPEKALLPVNCFNNCQDLWLSLKKSETGYTESTSQNPLRRYLKPNQKREARFDKIMILNSNQIKAEDIRRMGTDPGNQATVDSENTFCLMASDHFGLSATLSFQS